MHDTTFNTGGLHTSGIDVSATYRTGLDTFGLNNAGSVSLQLRRHLARQAGDHAAEGRRPDRLRRPLRRGLLGAGRLAEPEPGMASQGAPDLEHAVRIRLARRLRPLGPVALLLVGEAGRHVQQPGARRARCLGTDAKFEAQNYIDLLATWKIKDSYSFRAGVNNVFDNDPPLSGPVQLPGRPLQPERLRRRSMTPWAVTSSSA